MMKLGFVKGSNRDLIGFYRMNWVFQVFFQFLQVPKRTKGMEHLGLSEIDTVSLRLGIPAPSINSCIAPFFSER